jgi:hypothetical protein
MSLRLERCLILNSEGCKDAKDGEIMEDFYFYKIQLGIHLTKVHNIFVRRGLKLGKSDN